MKRGPHRKGRPSARRSETRLEAAPHAGLVPSDRAVVDLQHPLDDPHRHRPRQPQRAVLPRRHALVVGGQHQLALRLHVRVHQPPARRSQVLVQPVAQRLHLTPLGRVGGKQAQRLLQPAIGVGQDVPRLRKHALGRHQHRRGALPAGAPGDEPVHHLHVSLLAIVQPRPLQRPTGLLAVVADRKGDQSSHVGPHAKAGSSRPGKTSGSPSLTWSGKLAGRFSRNEVTPSRASADWPRAKMRARVGAVGLHRVRRRRASSTAAGATAPPTPGRCCRRSRAPARWRRRAARRARARCAPARRRAPRRASNTRPVAHPLHRLADAHDARQEPARARLGHDAAAREHEADLGLARTPAGRPSAASS